MADYWEQLGINTCIVDHGGYPVVYGTGGPVLRASFDTDAADNSYRVGANAQCAPGQAYNLNVEDDELRDQGEILPGDEYTTLVDTSDDED